MARYRRRNETVKKPKVIPFYNARRLYKYCACFPSFHQSGICNWERFSSVHSSSSRTFECSTRASLAATHCRRYVYMNKLGAISIIRLISAVQISSIPRRPPQCVVVPLLHLVVSIIHSVVIIIIGPELQKMAHRRV